ncbi:MAG: hypothetical protein ACREMM_09825 [Gemmatimonadales bacterium]
MSATAAPDASDRSDFRTVTLGGAKIGLITAAAVVAFVLVSRQVPGLAGRMLETLVVLAAGMAVTFLPGQWTAARTGQGIAGAAAMGLVGTITFMAIDIVALRPLRAYPWTWDAIGGNSTWWYLPIWWMLGTFLAWMGATVMARESASGETTLVRLATPTLVGTVLLVVVARLAGLSFALPAGAGAAFTITLAGQAVVALARKP